VEGDPELIPENNRHPDPYFDSYPGGARPPQDFAAPGPQRARNSAALCVVTPPSLPVGSRQRVTIARRKKWQKAAVFMA
jgi:hypothetical protein